MNYNYIALGGILAALSILFGALGAHWLQAHISLVDLQNFETAVRYQMYHAIGLILLGILYPVLFGKLIRIAFHAFWLGILLFSGSIYLLSTTNFSQLHLNWLGPVTPIGGMLFIVGWVLLVAAALGKIREAE